MESEGVSEGGSQAKVQQISRQLLSGHRSSGDPVQGPATLTDFPELRARNGDFQGQVFVCSSVLSPALSPR